MLRLRLSKSVKCANCCLVAVMHCVGAICGTFSDELGGKFFIANRVKWVILWSSPKGKSLKKKKKI